MSNFLSQLWILRPFKRPNRRFCADNPDARFAYCEVTQELADEDIDKQLSDSDVSSLPKAVQGLSKAMLSLPGV